jgi:hypothetical protein
LPLKFKQSYGTKFIPSVRSIIENIYGNDGINSWKYLNSKTTDSLEKQTLQIKAIYEILNLELNINPMRSDWLQRLRKLSSNLEK